MINKEHRLNIRAVNRAIFWAIRSGRKKTETRAATARYCKIKTGDTVITGARTLVRAPAIKLSAEPIPLVKNPP